MLTPYAKPLLKRPGKYPLPAAPRNSSISALAATSCTDIPTERFLSRSARNQHSTWKNQDCRTYVVSARLRKALKWHALQYVIYTLTVRSRGDVSPAARLAAKSGKSLMRPNFGMQPSVIGVWKLIEDKL